jgi:hypothetical protein
MARAAARADNHHLHSCTHIALKDNEVVGAFTLGPVVLWWLDSKCKFRDTAYVMAEMRARAEENGLTHVYLLCAKSSPYHAHMARLGLEFVGSTDIFERAV